MNDLADNRLVLLDAGGVVLDGLATTHVTTAVAEMTGAEPLEVRDYFKERINPIAASGRCGEDWAYEHLSRRFGALDVRQLRQIARHRTEALPGADQVLGRFSEQVPVWMLSNYIGPWLRESLSHRGLIQYFDRLFISSEIGVRKPSPEAFAKVIEAWSGSASQIAFVDDKPSNLSVAAELGMHTVHSTGDPLAWEAQLVEWLEPVAVG